jgi:quinol monooxygenase YgiN
MIVVVARIRTDDARREEAIRVGNALVTASRADEGCLSYALYTSAEDPNELLVLEHWESDEALQKHFETAHIAEFMRTVPKVLAAPPDIKFHTVESSRDLADVAG